MWLSDKGNVGTKPVGDVKLKSTGMMSKPLNNEWALLRLQNMNKNIKKLDVIYMIYKKNVYIIYFKV